MSDKNIVIGYSVDSKKLQSGLKEVGSILLNSTSNISKGLTPALEKLTGSTEKATEKFKSLRTQIRESTNAAAQLAEKYGMTHAATKQAVKAVGELKDRQEKLNEAIAASHPDAKFVVLKNAVQGAANAFAGIQGAMAIFGEQNKDVQAALLKVQGAMAFAQGIAAIEQLGIAFKGLSTVILANPIIAAAVAITALGAAVAAYFGLFKSHVSNQQKINKLSAEAAENAGKERAELELLVMVAKDETQSKELRQKAIKKLNEISPEYLGNLTLETINTAEATKAINSYSDAIYRNAKGKAIENAMTEEFNKQQKLQNELLDLHIKKAIDDKAVLGQGRLWGSYADDISDVNKKLKESRTYTVDLAKEFNTLARNGGLELFKTKGGGGTSTTKAPAKTKAIDYDAGELKSKTLSVQGIMQEHHDKVAPLAKIEFKANYNQNSFKSAADAAAKMAHDVNKMIESTAEQSFAALGEMIGGLLTGQVDASATFFDQILNITAGFLDTFGKALIAAGVASEAFKKIALTGLPAIAAGVALIATAGIVRNVMKSGLSSGGSTSSGGGNNSVGTVKFADGGIVGGGMYSGDKVHAMVNSGEMILNARQQGNLFNMIAKGSGGSGGGGMLTTRVSGNDLLIVLDRASKTRGRTF